MDRARRRCGSVSRLYLSKMSPGLIASFQIAKSSVRFYPPATSMPFHHAPKVCLQPPLKPWPPDCRLLLPMQAGCAIYSKMARHRAVSSSRVETFRLLRPRWDAFSTTRVCSARWRPVVGNGPRHSPVKRLENSYVLFCFHSSHNSGQEWYVTVSNCERPKMTQL